jgi:acyl carrier protein
MNVLETLQQSMHEVFANATLVIAPHMSALNIDGWDSLSHTLLVRQLESTIGVVQDIEAMAACQNIGAPAAYIPGLLQSKSGLPSSPEAQAV